MSEGPVFQKNPRWEKPTFPERAWMMGLSAGLFSLLIVLTIGLYGMKDERDAARATAADLQTKLDAAQADHRGCQSENIELRSTVGSNEVLMKDAADLLYACFQALPAGTRLHVPRRFVSPSGTFNLGSQASAPPQ